MKPATSFSFLDPNVLVFIVSGFPETFVYIIISDTTQETVQTTTYYKVASPNKTCFILLHYNMIIIFRLYSSKFLPLQVLGTWIGGKTCF